MAGEVREVSQDEFASWVPIRAAVELLKPTLGAYRHDALVSRLASGLITAAAENYVVGEQKPAGITVIPPKFWLYLEALRSVSSDQVWTTNDLSLRLPDGSGVRSVFGPQHKFFGVRLEPPEFEKMLSSPQNEAPPDSLPQDKKENSAKDRQERRPVSETDLDRWAQVFTSVYNGKDFDGPLAHRSAAAMFPDNTVGRDRVVDALAKYTGLRKRGPKKTIV